MENLTESWKPYRSLGEWILAHAHFYSSIYTSRVLHVGSRRRIDTLLPPADILMLLNFYRIYS